MPLLDCSHLLLLDSCLASARMSSPPLEATVQGKLILRIVWVVQTLIPKAARDDCN